ncbi:hypothetical protein PBRA_007461 [Plasmodiophora brassicae]|nr:hypothetical protein PBRA_007461 [Plasmodiophora brassicae]
MPLLFVLALFGAVIPHGSPLFLRMAGRTMPKQPADPATSDQDAFFVRHDLQSFAVADGVGGYGQMSAVVSRGLLRNIIQGLDELGPAYQAEAAENAVNDLDNWYRSMSPCSGLHNGKFGGSTLLCASLNPQLDGVLDFAHVGDCIALVIRKSDRTNELDFAFKLEPQYHPDSMVPCQLDFPLDRYSDEVSYSYALVQPGDLIIAATDGILDNVFPRELLALARRHHDNVDRLADAILEMASTKAYAPTMVATPFSSTYSDWSLPGGKPDDMTVVVAHVLASPDPGHDADNL